MTRCSPRRKITRRARGTTGPRAPGRARPQFCARGFSTECVATTTLRCMRATKDASSRRGAALAVVLGALAALTVSACGAKTGLITPDVADVVEAAVVNPDVAVPDQAICL